MMYYQLQLVPLVFKWIDEAPYGDRGAYDPKAVEIVDKIVETIKEEQKDEPVDNKDPTDTTVVDDPVPLKSIDEEPITSNTTHSTNSTSAETPQNTTFTLIDTFTDRLFAFAF